MKPMGIFERTEKNTKANWRAAFKRTITGLKADDLDGIFITTIDKKGQAKLSMLFNGSVPIIKTIAALGNAQPLLAVKLVTSVNPTAAETTIKKKKG